LPNDLSSQNFIFPEETNNYKKETIFFLNSFKAYQNNQLLKVFSFYTPIISN